MFPKVSRGGQHHRMSSGGFEVGDGGVTRQCFHLWLPLRAKASRGALSIAALGMKAIGGLLAATCKIIATSGAKGAGMVSSLLFACLFETESQRAVQTCLELCSPGWFFYLSLPWQKRSRGTLLKFGERA